MPGQLILTGPDCERDMGEVFGGEDAVASSAWVAQFGREESRR
jgi:hypothetical protein